MSGALPPIPIGLHNVHRKNLTFNFILSLVQHLKNLTKHWPEKIDHSCTTIYIKKCSGTVLFIIQHQHVKSQIQKARVENVPSHFADNATPVDQSQATWRSPLGQLVIRQKIQAVWKPFGYRHFCNRTTNRTGQSNGVFLFSLLVNAASCFALFLFSYSHHTSAENVFPLFQIVLWSTRNISFTLSTFNLFSSLRDPMCLLML